MTIKPTFLIFTEFVLGIIVFQTTSSINMSNKRTIHKRLRANVITRNRHAELDSASHYTDVKIILMHIRESITLLNRDAETSSA